MARGGGGGEILNEGGGHRGGGGFLWGKAVEKKLCCSPNKGTEDLKNSDERKSIGGGRHIREGELFLHAEDRGIRREASTFEAT